MIDDDLLNRFETGDLDRFSHLDHVKIVFLQARRAGSDETVAFARKGLRALTCAAGVPEKYHDTITVAWARLVSKETLSRAYDSFEDFVNTNPQFANRDLLDQYYSHDRLFSPGARARFVEPDLQPLP